MQVGRRRMALGIGTAAYTAGLAVVSLLPSGRTGFAAGWDASISGRLQDAMHVVAYGILAVLMVSFVQGRRQSPRSLLAGGLCAWGVGLLLELSQQVVPGRCAGVSDVVRNTIGVGLGLGMMVWCWRVTAAAAPERNSGIRGDVHD